MKNTNPILLIGALGVFTILILIVLFVGFGWTTSDSFVPVSEIVGGVAIQVFNTAAKKDEPEPEPEPEAIKPEND